MCISVVLQHFPTLKKTCCTVDPILKMTWNALFWTWPSMSCYNISLLCRFPTPYVCSSLAWQTEKWHKKNINSADRKHSTTLLRVTMMMVWTSRIWWRWLLMFWFQCRSSPWCVWPVSPNGILIAHLWRRWLPFNGLQYNWLNMYYQWGFDSLFWWERFWFHYQ